PPESSGGWRKATDAGRLDELGISRDRLSSLGSYLMSLPYEEYSTGVSGYKASNKGAIVIKGGWIVGEWYNQSGADRALYYTASNGKTFAMLLAGHLAQTYSGLNLTVNSKLYDKRWMDEGFALSDSRKSAITLDHVFRHTSGIIPESAHQIASGAVQTETSWNFGPFTVGKDAQWPQSARLWYDPGQPAQYGADPYSSVAFNHLSLVFRNVTGKEPGAYLQQAILGPVGVGKVAYKLTGGMEDWKYATAGNALLTARDFARLGYLMLHEGDWNGRRLFAAAWLRRFTGSTAYPNVRTNRNCRWGAKYPADMYRTIGSGQNWILVVPSLDLILTFNGRTPKSKAAEVDRESLKRLFAAVTDRYVACDGTVVNGG
ncbi:MAG TPA: serine hydrolase, partial [Gemmatimonadales bacterium]|nr:serine hydrolase [Gemmatimonadales bacterium]